MNIKWINSATYVSASIINIFLIDIFNYCCTNSDICYIGVQENSYVKWGIVTKNVATAPLCGHDGNVKTSTGYVQNLF